MSNKKLFYVMSALAIAIAIPLTIHSANQQTETQSRAAELTSTTQTQTNQLGTVTTKSSSNLSQLASAPDSGGNKYYFLGVMMYKGSVCSQSGFNYKVNGLRFNYQDERLLSNLCITSYLPIVNSTANCNTFSLIPPSGWHNVGIGYKRMNKDMGNFTYERVTSKKLCDYNYIVTFAMEPD